MQNKRIVREYDAWFGREKMQKPHTQKKKKQSKIACFGADHDAADGASAGVGAACKTVKIAFVSLNKTNKKKETIKSKLYSIMW